MKKIAIILSGCGVKDGSEIHEAVMTMLAIEQAGASYEIFAPNIEQRDVVNHYTGKSTDESRNVLCESARIARGNINEIGLFDAKTFDALIFPGGFGVAKTLCNYAVEGVNCSVDNNVLYAIKQMHCLGKPIGGLCISGVLLSKVLGATVTIGNDASTAADIVKMGGKNKSINTCFDVVVDNENKVATVPCYMINGSIDDIYKGAKNLIDVIMKMMQSV